MNNLSSQFRARLAFALGSSAGKTGRCRGRITIAVCVAVALFSAKPISGLDQNGDGMSDVWQQHYSVPSSDANLDYNGTGLTNTQKSLLGLDPRDPNARFHLDIVNDFSSNQLRLRLNTVYGKRYQVESSTDLRFWIALNSPITGTGQPAQITLPLPQPPIFFRASYAGDIDADGDGLTAWEENLLGTNDNNSDSDNDGMPDNWEYSHGLNPILNDANNDLDGDGATNVQEYQAGTDPNDYYNGQAPSLIIVSGNRQLGFSGGYLPEPMIVEVDRGAGQPLSNAPVTFALVAGAARLATVDSPEILNRTITVRTSAEGRAQVLLYATPGGAGLQVVTANVSDAADHLTFFQITVDDSSTAPPDAPGTLTAKGISPGNNLLTWQDNSSSESGFWIERRGSDGIWIRIATVGANTVSYLDDRADTQVSYNYRVKAINRSGDSSWSEEATSQPWIPPLYQIEDLGQAPARRINNRGEVGIAINDAGDNIVTTGDTRVSASIWNHGEFIYDFGPIGGPYSSVAAINNQRQIAGYATYQTGNDNTYIIRDFIGYYLSDYDGWISVGRVTYDDFDEILHLDGIISSGQEDPNSERITAWLHLQGTTPQNASQFALYDTFGHAIRVSYDPVGVGTFSYDVGDAFLADADRSPLHHLGVLTGAVSVSNQSRATDLNDSGEVIGISGEDGFFWSQGTMQSLGVCVPQAINNSHQIVASHGSYPTYPFLIQQQAVNEATTRWTAVPLPILPGYETVGGTAQGINEKGDIVGSCGDNYEGLNGSATLWVSGTAFDLNKLVPPNSGWTLSIAYDINDKGWISGVGYKDHEIHTFRLRPAELMVDGNRDGQMSFDDPTIHDADQTTKDKPYRFWLNDDDDTELTDGTDGRPIGPAEDEAVPPLHPDYSLHQIISKRNLEDFARLWIYIGGIQDAISSGKIQVGLRWKNVTPGTTPAINIYPSADGDGSDRYVRDDAAAQAQISGVFNEAVRDKSEYQTVDMSGVFIFKPDYWNGLTANNPKKCLLFEGVSEGKGELTVVFLDQNNQEIGSGGTVLLDIKNVKKMYERAKAQPENIVAPYDINPPFTGPVNYVSDPNGHEFQKPWDENNQCLVFVHGWNMNYNDYANFGETMFKRLWWQGYKGHFAALRWDTRKSDGEFDTGEYNRSENRAFVYGAALKTWVTNLSASYTVSLVGHSMGNVVCGEALRQEMRVRNYLVMEAAIPMSCYDANAPQLARLVDQDAQYHTPDYDITPGSNEGTLGYRGYLQNVTGTLTNFFNPDDWALSTGFTLGHETNWESNQINYKPDGEVAGAVHDASWSYQYDPTYPLNQRAWVLSGEYRNVIESWEMKAFVARSRTKAAGVLDYTGGPIGAKINLRDDYGFGNTRPEHSGQFTRSIQKLDPLYKKMRETLEE
jgi:pimeloyl-ACP methyl ester carboxylesterase